MIPHRMLSNEIGGNGLKDRVTACRKRLRVHRVTHQAHAINEADELFPETVPAVSEFHCSPANSPVTPPALVRMNYSSAYESGELENGGMLLLTEEQEVGIT